jgi:hypothetical protein
VWQRPLEIRCAARRAVQRASGMGSSARRTFSISSFGPDAPISTLATAGWASGNCSAAAFRETPVFATDLVQPARLGESGAGTFPGGCD